MAEETKSREWKIIDVKTNSQVGKNYDSLRKAHKRADKLDLAYGAVRYGVKPIMETAAGGATGAGSIAVAPSRLGGGMESRLSLKSFLANFYKNIKNKPRFSVVKMNENVTDEERNNVKKWEKEIEKLQKMINKHEEDDDTSDLQDRIDVLHTKIGKIIHKKKLDESDELTDIISRLKGMENSIHGNEDTITYGVEDDHGNIMKVTVKKDQAKEFEHRLARDLAEVKDYKMSGFSGGDISMAELLYNLKQQFNIVDVEFPTIPKDVVYNADKASLGPDSNDLDETDDVNATDEEGFDDMGDGMGGEDMEGLGGNEDMEGLGNDEGMGDEDLEGDHESVEDFEENENGEVTPEGLLQSLLSMMKSDAEAKKAQADAAAEEARAKQAEYSYKSTQATVAQQEELMQMETEIDDQKQKEKEAKKLADLAKYRVQKTKSVMPEAFTSVLGTVIQEADDFDSEQSIRRQRSLLSQKYKVTSEDSPESSQYKRAMLQQSMRELDAKLKEVRIRNNYNRAQALKDQKANQNKINQSSGSDDMDSM